MPEDHSYVISPIETNRHRFIYQVSERRIGELALRLVGVLLQPWLVCLRDQALPSTMWMANDQFTAFDMTSIVRSRKIKVDGLQDGDVFSLDGGSTWYTCAIVLFGTVSVYTDECRDDDAQLVRIEADREDECLVLCVPR